VTQCLAQPASQRHDDELLQVLPLLTPDDSSASQEGHDGQASRRDQGGQSGGQLDPISVEWPTGGFRIPRSRFLKGKANYDDWINLIRIHIGAAGIEYANGKPPKPGSLARKDDYQLAAFLRASIKRSACIDFHITTSGTEILAALERRFRGKDIQGQSQLFTKFTSIRLEGKDTDSITKYIDRFNILVDQLASIGMTQPGPAQIGIFLRGIKSVLPDWVKMQQILYRKNLNEDILDLQADLLDEAIAKNSNNNNNNNKNNGSKSGNSMANQQAIQGQNGQNGQAGQRGRRGCNNRNGRGNHSSQGGHRNLRAQNNQGSQGP
jgi:hypothetical protein